MPIRIAGTSKGIEVLFRVKSEQIRKDNCLFDDNVRQIPKYNKGQQC